MATEPEVVFEEAENETKDSLASYTKAITNFSFDFAKTLPAGENTAYSPYGVAAALSVLANGLDEKAPVRSKLLDVLGAKSLEDLNAQNKEFLSKTEYGDANIFRTKNLLLVDQSLCGADSLNLAFLQRVQENYPITARTADFRNNLAQEKKLIKQEVNEATNGFMPDYESQADNSTDVDLMNITYFKGKWMYPFKKENTKKGKFKNAKGKTSKVDLMTQTFDEKIRYYEDKNFRGIILPYAIKNADGHYASQGVEMYVILPKKKSAINGVKQWNKKKASYKRKFLKKLKQSSTYNVVDLKLPTFETDVTYDLEKLMNKEGIGGLFSGNAGITQIVDVPLQVSSASQRTKIRVDEEGTEAAAVTEFVMKATSVRNPPKKPHYTFNCKVPFVYMICDTNGMPIFCGSVSDLQK